MARKKRDYAAEYRRRIERAEKRKIPKSVARGHAGKGLVGIREKQRRGLRTFRPEPENEVQKDSRKRFGSRKKRSRKPRRKKGENVDAFTEKLEERQIREESKFPWTDIDDFVAAMAGLGLNEREAYTLWFS